MNKMKTCALAFVLMFLSTISNDQDLIGDWSGKLDVQGTQLSIILHVNKTDDKFKATLDSPDQNTFGIPVTSIVFDDPKIKFEISNLGVEYRGTISAKEISGKWMQSGQSFSLTLSRKEN